MPILRQTDNDALPSASGGFQLSSFYSGKRSQLWRRQFTGKAAIRLHDPTAGEAAVAIADLNHMSLAYIRSTGHEVLVSEPHRPNLLVAVTGTLSSRLNERQFVRTTEPWVLFGRGHRETSVFAGKNAPYQALVLSMPPDALGDRLTRLEARGGIVAGNAPKDDDRHLAQLMLALATQIALSAEFSAKTKLSDAWTTILVEQINRCLDMILHPDEAKRSDRAKDPSLVYVRSAEELIFKQASEFRSVKDIAHQVGVSERTLQLAFRKIRGTTPSHILSQARLHCARRALLDRKGPDTVSGVCSLCGIEHHGRFSRLYKEAFGEHPVATLKARLKT